MIKAYRVIEKTYICGELENTYKCNKVLYTEEEAQEYNENHTYLYDTVEKIKEWHKKEFIDNFGARVKIIYPFFTDKFQPNRKHFYNKMLLLNTCAWIRCRNTKFHITNSVTIFGFAVSKCDVLAAAIFQHSVFIWFKG